MIVYIPLWFLVWKHPSALRHGFEKYGPTIKINSRFGLKFIDRFGKYARFWHICGIFAQIVSFVLMAVMIFIMVMAVVRLPATLSRGGIGIEYALALPGLNPMLPFWFGVLGLIVAMVCHEMAHGLQSRANNIGVRHTGLLYAVVPLGAFVEPNQEDVERASRRAKIDLYTAGITTNFVIAAISFLLFSVVMLGGLGSPYEGHCAVYSETEGSPADIAGIPAGAVILDINGAEFRYDDISRTTVYTGWEPGSSVDVHYRTEHREDTVRMVWGVYVDKTVENSPAHGILEKKWIKSIKVGDETHYFYTHQAFSDFMQKTRPGEEVTVNYVSYENDTRTDSTWTGTLGSNGSIGYLGVFTTTSGMNVITPEMMLEMGANPLYGVTDVPSYAQSVLSFIAHPLSGFDPIPESVQWWYGEQAYGYWTVCHILYWIFWLNIMLGITNALPAIPFDGGFVFMGWVDAALEKTGLKDRKAREEKAMNITRNVSSLMLFLYMIVIIAAIM